MVIAVATVLAACLIAIVAVSAIRPYGALRILLVLLPLHSAFVLLFANVIRLDGRLVTLASAWKEALIVGLVIACVPLLAHVRSRIRLVHWFALALIVLIGIRIGIDLVVSTASPIAVLFGARQLGEVAVLFLAVALLRPSPEWLLGTARTVLPVIVICALFALAQPTLGAGFYDEFFHAPGEQLHHSYLVNIGEMRRLRAVGSFIAPNELGIGLIVYGAVFVMPLLAVVRRWWLLAGAGMLLVFALLLSFSRSAWLGAAVGVLLVGLVLRRELVRLWREGRLVKMPLRELLLGLAAALAGTIVVFALVGGLALVAGTVSGSESSAAGRGESIGGGIEATFDNPGGLGLGTAGPRALELTGTSVLTENWYLVYSIQLGLVALAVLVALCLAATTSVLHAARLRLGSVRARSDPLWRLTRYQALVAVGTGIAIVAAFVGGLVIPALLDLPASLALWGSAAVVIGWLDGEPDAEAPLSP